MKHSIYIDDTLPNFQDLEEYFLKKDFEIVRKDKVNEADIRLIYAHDTDSRMNVNKYEDYSKNDAKAKTVFLLWYNWTTHYNKHLSAYFHPKNEERVENLHLFDETKYRHIQLPASNEQIETSVKELLNQPSK